MSMGSTRHPVSEGIAAILEAHLRLDAALDGALNALVSNTESSAVATIERVRRLYDSATRLGGAILGAHDASGDFGTDIVANLAHLVQVGEFVEQLPARMQRDLRNAKEVVKEIGDLSGLVEDVQSISLQSHMLAINTAIQASHVGAEGAAFRVMAEEMRMLAGNSKSVASRIIQGLSRARDVVEKGMASSIAESSRDLDNLSDARLRIEQLRGRLEDMNRQFKTRLATVSAHNEALVRDIEEILGLIQYQDIVRQSIERIRATVGKRNEVLVDTAMRANGSGDLSAVPEQLELLLSDYEATENNHTRAALHETGGRNEVKIELF